MSINFYHVIIRPAVSWSLNSLCICCQPCRLDQFWFLESYLGSVLIIIRKLMAFFVKSIFRVVKVVSTQKATGNHAVKFKLISNSLKKNVDYLVLNLFRKTCLFTISKSCYQVQRKDIRLQFDREFSSCFIKKISLRSVLVNQLSCSYTKIELRDLYFQ